MDANLEQQIFGAGDSDLSDLDDDDAYQAPQAPPQYAPEPEPSDEDDDYDAGAGAAADEDYTQIPSKSTEIRPHKLPKIKKISKTKDKDVAATTESSRKKRQKKKTVSTTDQITPLDEEPIFDPIEKRRKELSDQIEAAARGTTSKGRKRKRLAAAGGEDDLELMADEEVAQLRQNMMAAANQDQESNEAGRPAISKVMLLPIVVATMQKSHLEASLLDNNVLHAVKRWLEPLPDKSLPALNIQRSLLRLLQKMSIDGENLRSSDLGKVVLFYTKCKRVEPSIKRMADDLVMTWMRPIMSRSANYRQRQAQLTTSTMIRSSAPAPRAGFVPAPVRSGRIPEVIRQAYSIAPESQLDSQGQELRVVSQKATAKKSREWTRRLDDAKRGERKGK